jgi:hypothetical protein
MVSGSISLPSKGFFSPFPHGTGSLSVTNEYLALDRGRPRFTQNSTSSVLLRNTSFRFSISSTGLSPSTIELSRTFDYRLSEVMRVLQPQSTSALVWALPISLAATPGISSISFPLGTEMFHFPRFAPYKYGD